MTALETRTFIYRTEAAGGAVVDVFHPDRGGFNNGLFRVVCEMHNDLSQRATLQEAELAADVHAARCREVPTYRLGTAPAPAPKPRKANCTCACHGTEVIR